MAISKCTPVWNTAYVSLHCHTVQFFFHPQLPDYNNKSVLPWLHRAVQAMMRHRRTNPMWLCLYEFGNCLNWSIIYRFTSVNGFFVLHTALEHWEVLMGNRFLNCYTVSSCQLRSMFCNKGPSTATDSHIWGTDRKMDFRNNENTELHEVCTESRFQVWNMGCVPYIQDSWHLCMWWHRSGWTLALAMACYQNQCWITIKRVFWYFCPLPFWRKVRGSIK